MPENIARGDKKKPSLLLLASFLAASHLSCGYRPLTEGTIATSYEIRVGILENRVRVDFAVVDACRFIDTAGHIVAGGKPKSLWRASVREGRPQQMVYLLEVETTRNKTAAETLVANLGRAGVRTAIDVLGTAVEFDGRVFSDRRTYRVRIPGTFPTRERAAGAQSRLSGQVWTKILSEPSAEPNGIVDLQNLETGERIYSRALLQITGSRVALKGVTSGEGYHYESIENRLYRGSMEFRVDKNGNLMVINIIELDDYLRGVVPYEMAGTFPLEALKAQAVAARTRVLSSLGSRHADAPFDVCDDTHCQVYGGIRQETENSTLAVTATSGLVLTHGDELCDAVYSSMCGGHTEDAENVWPGDSRPYLRGVLDINRGREYSSQLDLSDQNTLRRWLEAIPRVFCNTVTTNTIPALEYTKKNFRWEVHKSAEQVRTTVTSLTGKDPGTLSDIIPLRRGVSGRLIDIQVTGRVQTITISKELQIRRALSNPPLLSACIIIEKGRDQRGNLEFVFRGAGSGHGVGMCQTGAAMMALQGKSFSDILLHYYHEVAITRLY